MQSRKSSWWNFSTAAILSGLGSVGLTLYGAVKSGLQAQLVNDIHDQYQQDKDIDHDLQNLHQDLNSTSYYLGMLTVLVLSIPTSFTFIESASHWTEGKRRLHDLNENADFILGVLLQTIGGALGGAACYKAGANESSLSILLALMGIASENIGSQLVLHNKNKSIPEQKHDAHDDKPTLK